MYTQALNSVYNKLPKSVTYDGTNQDIVMESKEKVDAILESIREELRQFVEEESQITSSTEYEERVLALSRKFAVELIAKSQGELPKSRNSKKSDDQFRSAGIKKRS